MLRNFEDKSCNKLLKKIGLGDVFLVISTFIFTYFAVVSTGVMGGGDSYAHFLISKYSWQHPHLFFDHWGKPVFTLLSSPFSQWGMKGMLLFNGICGFSSALIVRQLLLEFQLPTLSSGALLFTPFFAANHVSGLTEPLFTLLLTLSVWLFVTKRWMWMALILGLLPFVRTEGILFVFIFLVLFSYKRQWKNSLVLLLPSGLLSTVGAVFHQGDVFWLLTKMPYSAESFYQAGSWFHFIRNSDIIFGIPLLIFGCVGLFLWWRYSKPNLETLLVFVGFPVVYFGFHTVLFANGWGASAGLKRVMIVLTPTLAIFSAFVFGLVQKVNTNGAKILQILFVLAVLGQFLSSSRMPVKATQLQEFIAKAKAEISLETAKQKVFYFHPMVPVELEINPFNENQSQERISVPTELKKGDWVIWDQHFGGFEAGIKFEELKGWKALQQRLLYVEKQDSLVVFQCVKEE